MTLADFYVLAGQETQDQMQFACRLLEKAIANNNSVLLHTDNEQQAKDLDALIWSFRPDAFIPHTILGADRKSTRLNSSHVRISYAVFCLKKKKKKKKKHTQ